MTTPYHDEDAQIVYNLHYLEAFWRHSLDTAQKTAWTAVLDAAPPQDTYGNYYTRNDPPAWNFFKVPQQRLYAWSQIYALYRFGIAPLTDPVAVTSRTLSIAAVKNTGTQLRIFPAIAPWPGNPTLIITLASPSHPSFDSPASRSVRPMCAHVLHAAGVCLDFATCYVWRYGAMPTDAVTVNFGMINENHYFVPCPTPAYMSAWVP